MEKYGNYGKYGNDGKIWELEKNMGKYGKIEKKCLKIENALKYRKLGLKARDGSLGWESGLNRD